MSKDISSALPPPTPVAAPVALRAAAAPAKAAPEPVELKIPDRPKIEFDAEEMRRNLQDAIQRLNEMAQSKRQNLNFRIDDAANRFVITVKNTQSGEVIRQIPNEAVLKVAHNIEELKGLLLNEVI